MTLAEFSSRLASADPVPGGGSAAAVAGSLGAALAVMVARLSQDRPRYAGHAATHARVIAEGEVARGRFLVLAEEDAAAYGEFVAALKLPRESEAEQAARRAALGGAARVATAAPLATVRLCRTTMDLVEALAGRSNVNAASDVEVAALLLEAAAAAAAANVRINLPAVPDTLYAGATEAEVLELVESIHREAARVREIVASGEAREAEFA